MKTVVRIISLFMIVVITTVSLSGCSKEKEQITNLLAEFEYSCNTLDVNAILNCINPSTSDKIRLAISIYGMFSDKDNSEILDDISQSLIGEESLDGNDFFSSIKIEPKSIKVDDEEAVASAMIEYKVNGEIFNRMADFNCIYYIDKWYISKFHFA